MAFQCFHLILSRYPRSVFGRLSRGSSVSVRGSGRLVIQMVVMVPSDDGYHREQVLPKLVRDRRRLRRRRIQLRRPWLWLRLWLRRLLLLLLLLRLLRLRRWRRERRLLLVRLDRRLLLVLQWLLLLVQWLLLVRRERREQRLLLVRRERRRLLLRWRLLVRRERRRLQVLLVPRRRFPHLLLVMVATFLARLFLRGFIRGLLLRQKL